MAEFTIECDCGLHPEQEGFRCGASFTVGEPDVYPGLPTLMGIEIRHSGRSLRITPTTALELGMALINQAQNAIAKEKELHARL